MSGNGSHHEETNSQFHFPAALLSAKEAVPINRNLDGSQSLFGHGEERKKSLPVSESVVSLAGRI